jgi:hypothetical protein
VYFKTKYITQPTLTLTDVIIKALNDLTQALKRKNNMKGLEQIESLQKLEDILNNSLKMFSTPLESTPHENRRVTFNQAT